MVCQFVIMEKYFMILKCVHEICKVHSLAKYVMLYCTGDDILRNSNRWKCLSTGCLQVDRLLRGGVPSRGITELAGQSGSGKTQLCLQLALTVQLPFSSGGLDSGKCNW